MTCGGKAHMARTLDAVARAGQDDGFVIRERWFGATGRKVPAAIHQAHHAGTPVVIRASTAGEVYAALSLGPVACVLVRDEALLSLDLAEMTYG